MAILFVAQKRLFLNDLLRCSSQNNRDSLKSFISNNHAFKPVGQCKWTVYLAECEVMENLTQLRLITSDHQHDNAEVNINIDN